MDLLCRIAGWLGENEQDVIKVSRELGARWIDGLREAGLKE
jgi:hypothetical protein